MYTYTHVHIVEANFLSLQRWDMSVTEEMYTTPPPMGKVRTLTSLHTNCTFSKPNKHLGSKHHPLLELEPSQYVVDELHLLLRVADILLRNIIHFADHLDQTNHLIRGSRTRTLISRLENMVKSCAVAFKISPVSQLSITETGARLRVLVVTFRCRMKTAEL